MPGFIVGSSMEGSRRRRSRFGGSRWGRDWGWSVDGSVGLVGLFGLGWGGYILWACRNETFWVARLSLGCGLWQGEGVKGWRARG